MNMTDGKERPGASVAALIRRAVPEDIPGIRRIEEQCFRTPWSEQLLRDMLESPLDLVWVAVPQCRGAEDAAGAGPDAGLPAGYIDFRAVAGEGELMRIAVLPEFRRYGIAGQLMRQMISAADAMGISDITLEVRESNTAARSLYAQFGFAGEAVRRNYYDNPQENAVIEWRRS